MQCALYFCVTQRFLQRLELKELQFWGKIRPYLFIYSMWISVHLITSFTSLIIIWISVPPLYYFLRTFEINDFEQVFEVAFALLLFVLSILQIIILLVACLMLRFHLTRMRYPMIALLASDKTLHEQVCILFLQWFLTYKLIHSIDTRNLLNINGVPSKERDSNYEVYNDRWTARYVLFGKDNNTISFNFVNEQANTEKVIYVRSSFLAYLIPLN